MKTKNLSALNEALMTQFRELDLPYVHTGAAQAEAEFAFEVTRHLTSAEGYVDAGYADYVCNPLYWQKTKA